MRPASTDARSTSPQPLLLVLYHFCRLQVPAVVLSFPCFEAHLQRMFGRSRQHSKTPVANWQEFLDRLQPLDAFVASACVENCEEAWQVLLFDARVGRQERRLVDALRLRAVKMYPGNEERQNSVVDDFWGHLIVAETDGSVPVLQRYDGLRPLVPWLVCIFQNWQISQLRARDGRAAPLDVDDLLQERQLPEEPTDHWHESFCDAARLWLKQLADEDDLLLLGLLWRYRMSQREAAKLLGLHEGTISRRVKQLSEKCLGFVGDYLRGQGWGGDDLSGFIYNEMAGVLLDEPRLGTEPLARMLRERGMRLPAIA
jgi:RNA polymerase sigma factor (sigma-70 family)